MAWRGTLDDMAMWLPTADEWSAFYPCQPAEDKRMCLSHGFSGRIGPDGVGVAEWRGPLVVAGSGSFQSPTGRVFELVVVTAERSQVVHFGWTAFSPIVRVVEV